MDLTELPFIVSDSTGKVTDTWNVTPSNDWKQDCDLGRKFFYQTMRHGVPTIVRVTQGIVAKGQMSGIETGFLTAMAMETQ